MRRRVRRKPHPNSEVKSDRDSLQNRVNDLEKLDYDSNQNDVKLERLEIEVNKLRNEKLSLENGEKTQFERLTKANNAKSKVEELLAQKVGYFLSHEIL